ncbi:hypothetical protein T265_12196 [Opisthorchis viverrini]|uniref:Uncharacterized protein n=1 Tax=Opisthorchis viverrini TaxID=6198 RepID=A0A074YVB0_OPIVI|nr:hypothetical protein T265_12196 [Opisthorchis viverrini]KER18671.1 hypothetical protein T265_12196 [Opisthorchis viverrini]
MLFSTEALIGLSEQWAKPFPSIWSLTFSKRRSCHLLVQHYINWPSFLHQSHPSAARLGYVCRFYCDRLHFFPSVKPHFVIEAGDAADTVKQQEQKEQMITTCSTETITFHRTDLSQETAQNY